VPVGPIISAVTATAITSTEEVVSWSLNEPATGQVEYGPTTAYGGTTTAELSFTFSAHVQQLSALNPGTLYHFRVRSQDAAGNLSVSGDYTFTTLGLTPVPTPASDPTLPMGVNADTLGNTQIGGTNNSSTSKTSYRFRAGQSATLTSVRVYFVTGHAGYSGGTGGKIEVTLQTDDGTTTHAPSGTILASLTVLPGNVDPSPTVGNGLVELSFGSPAAVTAGQLYHIVFRNIDSAPSTNYCSVDGMYVGASLTPRQPRYADSDWAQLINNTGSWSVRSQYSPIMDVKYSNGVHEGLGYANAVEKSYKLISGTAKVRESFTVSGSTQSVTSVAVRLARVIGSSPLTIRLETAAGALIEQGTVAAIPAVAVPGGSNSNGTGATWATLTLSTAQTLTSGQSYNIVLSSPADTSYWITPLRKGGNYNFAPATYFTAGSAQENLGAGWTGLNADGQVNSNQFDWQWYMR
jgi:hypothetical protein